MIGKKTIIIGEQSSDGNNASSVTDIKLENNDIVLTDSEGNEKKANIGNYTSPATQQKLDNKANTSALDDKADISDLNDGLNNKVDIIAGRELIDSSALNSNGTLNTDILNNISALLFILNDTENLRNEAVRRFSTPALMNSNFDFGEGRTPFSAGHLVVSSRSTGNGFFGVPFQIFRSNSNVVSFTLHYTTGGAGGRQLVVTPGASYRITIIARGTGASIGKIFILGAFRPNVIPDRLENSFTLGSNWQVFQTDAFLCPADVFILYLHLAGRGGTFLTRDQIQIAAYFLEEIIN